MDKRILLIGGGKSFMVTSIAKELTSEGFDVIQSSYNVTEIEHIENKPNVYLIYVDDVDDMNVLGLSFLHPVKKRTCDVQGVAFIPLGASVQNEDLHFRRLQISIDTKRLVHTPEVSSARNRSIRRLTVSG